MIKKKQHVGKRGLRFQERNLILSEDPEAEFIIEDPKEDSITEKPKEDPITQEPKENLITGNSKKYRINVEIKENPRTEDLTEDFSH